MATVKDFITRHFRHFNAAALRDAAEAWTTHVNTGGIMLLTMGGAMSTAEQGISLARLIRGGKVHALCVTGANLEEDLFNLVAHENYLRLPNYRDLTSDDEMKLLDRGLNRVTDTCIPEAEAMRRIEQHMLALWQEADRKGEQHFPHEYFYKLFESKRLEGSWQSDPADSWLLAAYERRLPIWVPGWEDSTLGNMFVAAVMRGDVKRFETMRSGLEQMASLARWYTEQSHQSVGFFQIGGGISGDFPICVVPMLVQDLKRPVPCWGYFCQISEATTSYGSYSGAVPNEKITWGKLTAETPRFVIESDATIVFPLIAAYVLDA